MEVGDEAGHEFPIAILVGGLEVTRRVELVTLTAVFQCRLNQMLLVRETCEAGLGYEAFAFPFGIPIYELGVADRINTVATYASSDRSAVQEEVPRIFNHVFRRFARRGRQQVQHRRKEGIAVSARVVVDLEFL